MQKFAKPLSFGGKVFLISDLKTKTYRLNFFSFDFEKLNFTYLAWLLMLSVNIITLQIQISKWLVNSSITFKVVYSKFAAIIIILLFY